MQQPPKVSPKKKRSGGPRPILGGEDGQERVNKRTLEGGSNEFHTRSLKRTTQRGQLTTKSRVTRTVEKEGLRKTQGRTTQDPTRYPKALKGTK